MRFAFVVGVGVLQQCVAVNRGRCDWVFVVSGLEVGGRGGLLPRGVEENFAANGRGRSRSRLEGGGIHDSWFKAGGPFVVFLF